jgi:hypothetical protein
MLSERFDSALLFASRLHNSNVIADLNHIKVKKPGDNLRFSLYY